MNPWALPPDLAEIELERQLAAAVSEGRREMRWAAQGRRFDLGAKRDAKPRSDRPWRLKRLGKAGAGEARLVRARVEVAERCAKRLRLLECYAQAAELEGALGGPDLAKALGRAIGALERAESEQRSAVKAALLLAV